MPCKNFVRHSSSQLIILIYTALLGFAASPAAAQNATISWNQPTSVAPVLAYQVYQDDKLLCETSNPAAREITCPMVVVGKSVFSVVALYGEGGGTTPTGTTSTTTTDPGPGGTTSGTTTGTTSGTSTGSTTPPPNQVPVANTVISSINENGVLNGTLNGSDPDGDALTYAILSAPTHGAVGLLNAATGQFRYTPDQNITGADSFSYSVSDGKATSNSATVSISIMPVNDPPVANAGPDQVVNEGDTVTLDATNSYDIDDKSITVSWVQLSGPAVTLSDPNAVKPQFAAIDAGVAGATLTFQLTVTDAQGLQDTDDCIVNIVWVNQPPVASAGADQSVAEGDTVVLDASGSKDVDDGIASYSWVQLSGPATKLSDSTARQPSFAAPDVGSAGASITYEVTVTDFGGLYTKDTVIINIAWINTPPVANAGVDQSVQAGDVVNLDGSLSYDADDGIASVQWLQKTGLPVTLSNPTVLQPTFGAPVDIQSPVTLTFELIVTDHGGLQHTDSCNVEILPLQPVVAGDLNGNGQLDSQDLAILQGAVGTCSGDAAYLSNADLNGDNCVTKNDVNIWRRYSRSQ